VDHRWEFWGDVLEHNGLRRTRPETGDGGHNLRGEKEGIPWGKSQATN